MMMTLTTASTIVARLPEPLSSRHCHSRVRSSRPAALSWFAFCSWTTTLAAFLISRAHGQRCYLAVGSVGAVGAGEAAVIRYRLPLPLPPLRFCVEHRRQSRPQHSLLQRLPTCQPSHCLRNPLRILWLERCSSRFRPLALQKHRGRYSYCRSAQLRLSRDVLDLIFHPRPEYRHQFSLPNLGYASLSHQ